MFSLICSRINAWVDNSEAGDLRRNHAHYDIIWQLKWILATILYAVTRGGNKECRTVLQLCWEGRDQHCQPRDMGRVKYLYTDSNVALTVRQLALNRLL